MNTALVLFKNKLSTFLGPSPSKVERLLPLQALNHKFSVVPLYTQLKFFLWFWQVDFDDGNCPTYHNQIKGILNVFKAVHNQFPSKWFIVN